MPDVLGSTLVVVALSALSLGIVQGGGWGWTGYSLADSASQLLDALPAAAQKGRQAVRTKSTVPSPLDTVQKAATAHDRRSGAADPGTLGLEGRRGFLSLLFSRTGTAGSDPA